MEQQAKAEQRAPALQLFVDRLFQAFEAAETGPSSRAALGRIRDALRHAGAPGKTTPARLPVCAHLDSALERADGADAPFAALAGAFAAIEPGLVWKRRASGGPFSSESWPDGHANAAILGSGGLEERTDLLIGVSLLAPNVRYPDHNHGPEEVYLVLSPGRFQHGASGWFEPGMGGTLYNEPDIRHAMASDEAPLLAVWCLWMGPAR